MTHLRPMRLDDILHFNSCNYDKMTETYHLGFYMEYLAKWPELCNVVVDYPGGWGGEGKERIVGYVLGKLESSPFPAPNAPYDPANNPNPNYLPWHGHITALTIAPSARRQGLASRLTRSLEAQCDRENAWFVDLFVRVDNEQAKGLYKKLGYSVYRVVKGYYSDGCDAWDMRKPLKRDSKNQTVIKEGGDPFVVGPNDVW